jgi:threonine dehydratase
VVPKGTPRVKKEGILALGAELIELESEPGYDAAEARARAIAEERHAAFVSPFDDPAIQAGGGGTIALEILEAEPRVERIVIPVGGGGLAAGLGAVIHSQNPLVEIVGAQSEASPAMARSLEDGSAHLTWPAAETLAEGLEGGVAASTFEACRRHLSGIGVAAILEDRIAIDDRTVVVLTGSNIDQERLDSLLREGG